MITRKEALHYDQQLHPAFAGYLFDGTITEADALAAVFHLLTKGLLEPIWKDGSMLKQIIAIRKTGKSSILPFNTTLAEEMFGTQDQLSAKEVGEFIKDGRLKEIIQTHLQAIASFPIINEDLKFTFGKHGTADFSVNGNPVNTIEEANFMRKLLYRLFLPLFLGLGILMIGLSFLLNASGDGEARNVLLLIGSIFILVITFIFLTFIFSQKKVTYDFKNKVEPLAKKRYQELFQFIKTHPLPKHRFINEFLAFSIAFGLETSWQKDFGLDKEITVNATPLT